MSATTFDLLINWIWPRPGESFSSEEAGLTPALYVKLHAAHPWLTSPENRNELLKEICAVEELYGAQEVEPCVSDS